jgi:hypothetical protein
MEGFQDVDTITVKTTSQVLPLPPHISASTQAKKGKKKRPWQTDAVFLEEEQPPPLWTENDTHHTLQLIKRT